MRKISWIIDSGHAWLKVPIKEIERLHISASISNFSYVDSDYAYLEEDCDACKYFNAVWGEDWHRNASVMYLINNLPNKRYNYFAPCRSFERWKGLEYLKQFDLITA